jgi:hypothetical protein
MTDLRALALGAWLLRRADARVLEVHPAPRPCSHIGGAVVWSPTLRRLRREDFLRLARRLDRIEARA